MLIGARTAAWGGGVAPLPYDAELQWIESNSDCKVPAYFDTGIKGSTNLRILCEVSLASDSTSSYNYIFGCGDGNNVNELGVWKNENIYGSRFVGSSLGNTPTSDLDLEIELSKTVYRINSTTRTSVTYGEWTNSFTMVVLGLNRGGSIIGSPTKMKLKSLSIYDNGSLARDFIPVRVGDVSYLYDKANSTGGLLGNGLYAKLGNGTLTNGPDKT